MTCVECSVVLVTVSCDMISVTESTFFAMHTLSMPIPVVDTTPQLIVVTSWWLAGSRYVSIDIGTSRQNIISHYVVGLYARIKVVITMRSGTIGPNVESEIKIEVYFIHVGR